ncbi:GRIM-19 protein [Colletotrichum fioriniae PJ7]|uniref:GRIM-19 protein n=1 Tax=Colletotrichum fioriniae PJ7 TaxID=1445577 RepID=A0A010QB51_9PEZI|nr:GRIM-19 protein [Colletotrichum fioriniae PJ7]
MARGGIWDTGILGAIDCRIGTSTEDTVLGRRDVAGQGTLGLGIRDTLDSGSRTWGQRGVTDFWGNHADYLKQRNLPARGFRPGTMLIVDTDTGSTQQRPSTEGGIEQSDGKYGLEEDRTVLTRHSELAREKMWARIHLIPLLQAEEDRDQVRRWYADQAREKELLGENTKVYHNERFVRPTFALAPQSKN